MGSAPWVELNLGAEQSSPGGAGVGCARVSLPCLLPKGEGQFHKAVLCVTWVGMHLFVEHVPAPMEKTKLGSPGEQSPGGCGCLSPETWKTPGPFITSLSEANRLPFP